MLLACPRGLSSLPSFQITSRFLATETDVESRPRHPKLQRTVRTGLAGCNSLGMCNPQQPTQSRSSGRLARIRPSRARPWRPKVGQRTVRTSPAGNPTMVAGTQKANHHALKVVQLMAVTPGPHTWRASPFFSDRVMSSTGPRSGPVHRRKQGTDLTICRTEGMSWNQNSSTTRG